MPTREINTRLTLDGEKAFNDQMKSVNNNLRNLSTELSATSAEYADNAGSVKALSARQEILTQQVDQQRVKVAALTQASRDAAAAYGEDSAQADKYRQQLNSARTALAKAETAEKNNKRALDDASKASTRFKNAVGDIKAKIDVVTGPLGKMASAAGAVTAATGKAAVELVKIGGAAAGVLATGLAAGTTALSKFAAEAAKNGTAGFETLASNMETLSTASASAKAALGGVLLPVLESLTSEGAGLLQGFSDDMLAAAGDTEKMGEIMTDYVRRAVQMLRTQLPQFLELGGDLLGGLGTGIVENLPEILDTASEIIDELLSGLETAAPQLAQAAVEITSQLIEFLAEHAPDLLAAGITMLATLISGIASALPSLIPVAIDMITELLTSLVTNAPMLISGGLELLLGVVQGLIEGVPQLIARIPEIVEQAKQAFLEKIPEFKSVGNQIVQGIWNGISGAWTWLYDKLRGWVSDVVVTIKNFLGIESPSRVMRDQVGRFMADGVVVGFVDAMASGQLAMERAIPTTFSLSSTVRSAASGGGGYSAASMGGSVVNIYTNRLDDATIDYIFARFNAKLGEAI